MKKFMLSLAVVALIALTSAFTIPGSSNASDDPSTYTVKDLSGQTLRTGLSEEDLNTYLNSEFSECIGETEKCATVIDESSNQEVPSLEPMHDD
jgi:hypothetical protein